MGKLKASVNHLVEEQNAVDKEMDPFPGGLVDQTRARPAGVSDAEWTDVMGPRNTEWGCSTNDICWSYAVAAITTALQDLSLVMNTVVAKAERGYFPTGPELSVFQSKAEEVMGLQVSREEAIQGYVLPALSKYLSHAESEQIKHLERCRKYRESRLKAFNTSIAGLVWTGGEKNNALGETKRLSALRAAKTKFDVLRTTTATLLQVEVEAVLWPVRKYLTLKEWFKLFDGKQPSRHCLSLLYLGRGEVDPEMWLASCRRQASPSPSAWLEVKMLAAMCEYSWIYPLRELCGEPLAKSPVKRLKHWGASIFLPKPVSPVA